MASEAFEKVKNLLSEIDSTVLKNKEELEQFRIKYLGSKNILKPLMGEIRNIANEQKKQYGQLVNELKQKAADKFGRLKDGLESSADAEQAQQLDLTAPAEPGEMGSTHPITITLNRIIDIFGKIGFAVAEDREIEDDWHNFTAMNTPEDHPARDMQDTFYLQDSTTMLLRTHTSSVQSRTMMAQQPPIRIIAPGRVYRNETISARAHCQFHQVEGLYIDENVSFADMKQTLLYFSQEMYGPDTKIRMRPSYFPFTEPSAEMDVSCFICNAEGCNVCKYTGWVEIMGCGMVDPKVLENCGNDAKRYSGFAFGMGIERQAMLLWKINDIRLLFENDVRFLKQFKSAL
ncbi:MAG: phenylalanyl-tRNA synthetase alpha chain [Patescibacteria group bacterium]|jgi:phenylalanyl-tRNA synthetase alpha chain